VQSTSRRCLRTATSTDKAFEVFQPAFLIHALRLVWQTQSRSVAESQRDSITQPRVDPQRGATLGHRPTKFINPERVESPASIHATPFNPFRVDDFICTEPRVGAGAPTLG
jgi:hypothetical protein